MKRDMDLVRKILIAIEEHPSGYAPEKLEIDGYSEDEIGHHVHLMGQANLLTVVDSTHMQSTSPVAIAGSITWTGHEFLSAAKSDSVWNQAKNRLGGTFQTVSLEVLKSLLISVTKEGLGLS